MLNPPLFAVTAVFVPPAPIMLNGLVMLIALVHEALPAATLIVSPEDALDTQAATEVRSAVLCQLGLEPVQAA